jgi:hypothetical protein
MLGAGACGRRALPSGGGVSRDGGVAAAGSARAGLAANAPASASRAIPKPVLPPAAPQPEDGGAATCTVLRGPIQLPMHGAVSLRVRSDAIDAILNDDGKPRVGSWPAGPLAYAPPPAGAEMAETPSTGALSVPCAAAGDQVFCPDRTGAVHRADFDGAGDRVIASSRAGARVAAATIGGTHTSVVYLASRMTSEGWLSEAWIAVDDTAPVRFSEDGSGATSVAVAPRGASLVALLVDARAALTAMHVRTLGYDGKVQIGEDVVVFVGGPGDRHTAGALVFPPAREAPAHETPAHEAAPPAPAWALLPISRDLADFGLAVVRLDVPPHVDEPVVWSGYLNGLDPAPVAAAATSAIVRGGGAHAGGRKAKSSGTKGEARSDAGVAAPTGPTGVWVARVLPVTAQVNAVRELELGELLDDGTFAPREVIATSPKMTDVQLVDDGHGAFWIAWTDSSSSWLERLTCR